MSAIETRQVHLHVGGFQLQNVTLSIPSEKITAIVGPNGSGKSTLLQAMTRLLTPDQGEVFVQDKPLQRFKTIELARTIALMTQSKHTIPNLTVGELVAYGRSPYKRLFDHMNQEDREIVQWAMEVTHTQRHENRMFHALSGGEQQKARIAMALAQKTTIILLDEPTTFLDIAHQLDVMEMLVKINEAYRITIVMVLHDLQQAANYCHYLVAMKRGEIQQTGNPKEVITAEFLKDIYQIEAKVRFEDNYVNIMPLRKL
ncbi:ABC transporter ATP-binding protein [Paenibacillus sp. MAH-36]|uniref:ABC transporter ATP-binding protein n=1 Tax=Paenibacillus violae TaxID=3077234 RepID=A0ABU3RL82_9BACL|nr:ABC transporter ATP-binding protein [Paenibacillus sp. PFR10]MDU0205056.1 ABC transporter ATP-binding protein [Paenibacillus sp. PFR10]